MTDSALFERQKALAGALLPLGVSLKGIAAIVGNATQENECKPVTEGAKDHGSDGLFQWRLERLTGPDGLRTWAGKNNLNWTLIPTQAAFFVYECKKDFETLWQSLVSGQKSIETLTMDLCDEYERPSEAGREAEKRINYARAFYEAMGIAQVVSSAPVAPLPPLPSPVDPVSVQKENKPMPVIGLDVLAQFAPVFIEAILRGVLSAHGVIPSHVATTPAPITPTAPALDVSALALELAKALQSLIPKV